ncbi:MAG: hypothetical protein AAGA54_04540, partial [Myxococcota bacterium]
MGKGDGVTPALSIFGVALWIVAPPPADDDPGSVEENATGSDPGSVDETAVGREAVGDASADDADPGSSVGTEALAGVVQTGEE